MRRALLLLALLAPACVPAPQEGGDSAAPGTVIEVDGRKMLVRQEYDWPSMIAPIDASTGKTVIVQSGTADTVIVWGAADDRDLAIRALAQFCDFDLGPVDRFDTQYVYQDPKTGDWWFDGFCS